MEDHADGRLALVAHEVFDGMGMRGAASVVMENGRILGLGAPADLPRDMPRVELDAGLTLAPGFVDCQVNGGGGRLLNDDPSADAMRAIAKAHRAFGTTSLLPTLITDAPEKMERLCEAAARPPEGVAGFHLEGPFINGEKRGAHPAAHVRDLTPRDVEMLAALTQAGKCLATLAPERAPPGAIRAIVEADVIVSLGHSNASARCARAAADEGAAGVTHLFNAMSQMTAREPGLVGAAFTDSRLFAGVIADGEHVAALNLALAHAIIGADRLMLVSDAMPSVGAARADFDLLGRKAILAHGRLTLEDGVLAGAHVTMAECVRRMVRLAHISLPDALRMATRTPARFLGLDHEIGMLRPGAYADLVALDASLNVANVWFRGGAVETRRWRDPQTP